MTDYYLIFVTQNDPSYAATEAQDWTQERDRQQTSYIKNDGQSLDGYKKAWEDLSAKLEAGKDEYIYSTDNKYLANEENVKDDVDLFSEGMELFKAGKIREAILAFEAEVKKDGSNSEAWRMLGKYSFYLSIFLYYFYICFNFLFISPFHTLRFNFLLYPGQDTNSQSLI